MIRTTGNSLNKIASYASEAYIIVDSRKCQGCQSCMAACSMVHEGQANLSLSRIQVMQNILKIWPEDILIAQCRQCVNARCIPACPTGALHIDTEHGNVRVIDESVCTGNRLCIDACPFMPQRIIWNPETGKAMKCDLCLNTPYWDEVGGPGGKQACIEVCPQQAIKFTAKIPEQNNSRGYDLNIRDEVSK